VGPNITMGFGGPWSSLGRATKARRPVPAGIFGVGSPLGARGENYKKRFSKVAASFSLWGLDYKRQVFGWPNP